MYIVIVGGGKVGSYLAGLLAEGNHEAIIIEQNKDRCSALSSENFQVVCGDGCEPYVLDEANTRKADAVVAVTGHDEDNLVVSLLGKFEYEVPMVIARINNPKNIWIFTKRFGVDIPVSNTQMIASLLLEEVTMGDLVTCFKMQKGDMQLLELTIKEQSKVVGKSISEIGLPSDCVIASIIRDGHLIIPQGMTSLELGDEILIVTRIDKQSEVSRIMG